MGINLDELISQLSPMPKVDLHRHLEGSLRLDTLVAIAEDHDLDLPRTSQAMASLVQVVDSDPKTVDNFLGKFKVIRSFFRSMDLIQRMVDEAVQDAAEEGVIYLELLFTPPALAAVQSFPLEEVADAVLEAAASASRRYGIEVNLIASINRHEPLEMAEKVVELALDRRDHGMVGLDLAGDESHFGAEPFKRIFLDASEGGLGLTVHAGEWGGPENVRFALEELGAQRIGHGVRILEDSLVLELVRDRRIPCEVCLSSNLLTGVDAVLPDQPLLRLMQAGLQVTLNSDDPSILRTSLSQEMALAISQHGLTVESLKGMVLAACQSAFLDRKAKSSLETRLIGDLMDYRLENYPSS